jgi:hypothetical protein
MRVSILRFLLDDLFFLLVKSGFQLNWKAKNANWKPFLLTGLVTQATGLLNMQQGAIVQ